MKALQIALLLALPLLSAAGSCCQVSSQAEQDSIDAADLSKQRALVKDLTGLADVIVVARATSASASSASATFSVSQSLKGQSVGSLTASWQGGITVSCHASDSFQDILLTTGETYLLYVREGQLLRAASTGRRYGQLTFSQERKLIRKYIGT